MGRTGRNVTSKEKEDSISHGAKHGGEALADHKGEEHVAGDVDGGSSSARLKRLNLAARRNTPQVKQVCCRRKKTPNDQAA